MKFNTSVPFQIYLELEIPFQISIKKGVLKR